MSIIRQYSVKFYSGLLADKPSNLGPGDFYYATDTGQDFRFNESGQSSLLPIGAGGVSSDAEQLLKGGSDGLVMLDPDDLVSVDAGNVIVKGTDGKLKSSVSVSSETVSGNVELATAVETTTGTDATRAVHPAGLKVELDKKSNSTVSIVDSDTVFPMVLDNAGVRVKASQDSVKTIVISSAPVDGATYAFFVGQLFWDNVGKVLYEALTKSIDPDSALAAGSTFASVVLSGVLEQSGIVPTSITAQGIFSAEGTNATTTLYAATGSQDRVMISSTATHGGTVISVQAGEYLNGILNGTYTTLADRELLLFLDNGSGKWTRKVIGDEIITSTLSLFSVSPITITSQLDDELGVGGSAGGQPRIILNSNSAQNILNDPDSLLAANGMDIVLVNDGNYRVNISHRAGVTQLTELSVNLDGVKILHSSAPWTTFFQTSNTSNEVTFSAIAGQVVTIIQEGNSGDLINGNIVLTQLSQKVLTLIDPTMLPVSNVGVANGDTLKWSSANTQYEPSAAPVSSETASGDVELATAAETTTGTDATRAVHPAGLKVELDKKLNILDLAADHVVVRGDAVLSVQPTGGEVVTPILGDTAKVILTDSTVEYWRFTTVWVLDATILPLVDATESVKGKVELATAAETTTGTDALKAVHPAGLKVELDKKSNAIIPTTDSDGGFPIVVDNAGVRTKSSQDALKTVVLGAVPVNGTTAAYFVGQFFWDNVGKVLYEALTKSTDPDVSGAGSTFQLVELGGGLNQAGIVIPSIIEQGIFSAEGTNATTTLYAATNTQDRVMISSTLAGVGTVISVQTGEYLNGGLNSTYTTQAEGELLLFLDNGVGKWTVQILSAGSAVTKELNRAFLHDNQAGSLNTTSGIQVVAITTPNSSVITGDLLDFATDYELLLGITKNVANTGLVISKTGLYSINAQMTFQQKLATSSAHARAGVQIIKNSSVILETSTGDLGDGQYSHNNVESTWTGYLSVGDVIEFRKCAEEDSKLQAYTVEIEQKATTESVMAGSLPVHTLSNAVGYKGAINNPGDDEDITGFTLTNLSGNISYSGAIITLPQSPVFYKLNAKFSFDADSTSSGDAEYIYVEWVDPTTEVSIGIHKSKAVARIENYDNIAFQNIDPNAFALIDATAGDIDVKLIIRKPSSGVTDIDIENTVIDISQVASGTVTGNFPFHKFSFHWGIGGQGVGGNINFAGSGIHLYDPQSLVNSTTNTLNIKQAGEYSIEFYTIKGAAAANASIKVNGVTKAYSQNIYNGSNEPAQLKVIILLAIGDVVSFPVSSAMTFDVSINLTQLA